MSGAIETVSEQKCFDGVQGFYVHESQETGTRMRFAVYRPPQAEAGPVPALYYLAGLTCTEETFVVKAGAQRLAAEHGLMLVAPDTSPRGLGLAGEDDDWDFGSGAGFYLDATQEPWAGHYRMGSYVTRELPALIEAHFPARPGARGIFGHSMGGHGALVSAFRNPGAYASVSAFAPICAPMRCPWGEKAFSGYLGPDRAAWRDWDASALVRDRGPLPFPILIDQGEDDPFLDRELKPELFEAACAEAGQALTLRRRPGYDHSYYFIATFMADHIAHHAQALDAKR